MSGKIFVGVDAGCREHAVVMLDEEGGTVWSGRIANDHAGCDRMLEALQVWKDAGYQVWVGAEGWGGYLSPLDIRLAAAGFAFVGFHPKQVKTFRSVVRVQPDKEDHLDARLLAEMLVWLEGRGELSPRHERDEYLRALRESARAFETATTHKVALQNRLVSKVREYWPELVVTERLFENSDASGLLALLSRYPTPGEVAQAGVARVAAVIKKAGCKNAKDKAECVVSQARAIRDRVKVSAATAMVVREMAQELLCARGSVSRWEKAMEEILQGHPFGAWLLIQRGISVRTAGCLLGEAGDLGRFESEAKLARYAGNGAIQVQSGSSGPRHYDGHLYNHHLKRALLLTAQCRAQHDEASARYVERRKGLGDTHWQAIKKLARHLIRFLWTAWQKLVKGEPLLFLSAPHIQPERA